MCTCFINLLKKARGLILDNTSCSLIFHSLTDNKLVLQTCFLFQTNIPVFKIKESSVRRRYRDFEWLKKELERDSKVYIYTIVMYGNGHIKLLHTLLSLI